MVAGSDTDFGSTIRSMLPLRVVPRYVPVIVCPHDLSSAAKYSLSVVCCATLRTVTAAEL
jgi:hypothetical protein